MSADSMARVLVSSTSPLFCTKSIIDNQFSAESKYLNNGKEKTGELLGCF
jgi:hypothetical protein